MAENLSENAVPKFWSTEFHFRFFPRLLWEQIQNHPDNRKGHILIEVPIAVVFCGVLVAIGLPGVVERHSVFGWLILLLGAGGWIALLVACLRGTAGTSLSYTEFEPWTFLFLAAAGAFGGFMGGNGLGSFWLGWMGALTGLGFGYLSGIGAGFWLQRLGPLRVFVALASGFGLLIVVGTAFIYLLYIRK
jgi:hypothetical protein